MAKNILQDIVPPEKRSIRNIPLPRRSEVPIVFENEKVEAELGLRVEYVNLQYEVNPNHNTYKSNGYNYTQPFPNIRLAWKLNDNHKISLFFNRRVDRPNEVDIRIFPKYDDAEIIKVADEHGLAMIMTGMRHFRH